MKICVTGALGFIGGELCKLLHLNGHEVIAVDDDDFYASKYPETGNNIFSKFYDWQDILDYYKFNEVLDGVSFVYHLGAVTSTRATYQYLKKSNYDFSKQFILQCLLLKKPVVFASSGAVFGTHRKPESNPEPLTEYGKSKLDLENWIKTHQLGRVICLRYHNVYGAFEGHKNDMASLVYKWLVKDFNGDETPDTLFYGSDNIFRDFIHVDDVNYVNYLLFQYFNRHSQLPDTHILEVGTGNPRSFQEMGEIISKITEKPIDYVPMPYDASNYQFYTKADIKDVNDLCMWMHRIGFNPVSLEDGIFKVYQSLKEDYML